MIAKLRRFMKLFLLGMMRYFNLFIKGRKIINDYCYVDTLGQGAFSKVKKVRNIKTNQEFV